jgi:hypothetical protein
LRPAERATLMQRLSEFCSTDVAGESDVRCYWIGKAASTRTTVLGKGYLTLDKAFVVV